MIEDKLANPLAWNICTFLARSLFSLSSRTIVREYAPLPKQGFILATNHISHFDPPLLSCAFPRTIDWIAIRELFHGRLLTGLFRSLNVIPIDRHGADRTALRQAARRLAAGRTVGIFPEGGIRDGAASILNGAPSKGGASVLATLAGAPIVPGVILGSDRLYNKRRWRPWDRATIRIGFGAAIVPPEGLSREEQRKFIDEALAAAFPALQARMKEEFHLDALDLPQPPRERMKEP